MEQKAKSGHYYRGPWPRFLDARWRLGYIVETYGEHEAFRRAQQLHPMDSSTQMRDIAKVLLTILDHFANAVRNDPSLASPDPFDINYSNILDHSIDLQTILKCEAPDTSPNAWPDDAVMDMLASLIRAHPAPNSSHVVISASEVQNFAPRLSYQQDPLTSQTVESLKQRIALARQLTTASSPETIRAAIPAANRPSNVDTISLFYDVGNKHVILGHSHYVHVQLTVDLQTLAGKITVHDSNHDNESAVLDRILQYYTELPLLAELISLLPGCSWYGATWSGEMELPQCPQQINAADSGLFAWQCALELSKGNAAVDPNVVEANGATTGRKLRLLALQMLAQRVGIEEAAVSTSPQSQETSQSVRNASPVARPSSARQQDAAADPSPRRFRCDTTGCEKSFAYRSSLRKHQRKCRGDGAEQFVCSGPERGEVFASEHDRNAHSQQHVGSTRQLETIAESLEVGEDEEEIWL